MFGTVQARLFTVQIWLLTQCRRRQNAALNMFSPETFLESRSYRPAFGCR